MGPGSHLSFQVMDYEGTKKKEEVKKEKCEKFFKKTMKKKISINIKNTDSLKNQKKIKKILEDIKKINNDDLRNILIQKKLIKKNSNAPLKVLKDIYYNYLSGGLVIT